MVTVCSVVADGERVHLDSVATGHFTLLHVRSLGAALRVARQRPVHALVVSVHECEGDEWEVARFVRDFPGTPTVAVLSNHAVDVPNRLLRLGKGGVGAAVDCTQGVGWPRLRDVLLTAVAPVAPRVLARVLPALGPASAGMRAFVETVVQRAPEATTVVELARRLHVHEITLTSRFHRAHLPSPRAYLAGMRLVYAAHHFSDPGLTLDDVAVRLAFASGQSLGRHIKLALGITATEFRKRVSFDLALERYIARRITPYRDRLRTFDPFGATKGASGER